MSVFRGVDLIVHAGDLVRLRVVEELEGLAPVVAVHGNMDPPEVRNKLPEINSIEVAGHKLGVTHNMGLWGRGWRKLRGRDFDIIVFGHTHRPSYKEMSGKVFVNPGSPTEPFPPFLTKPSVMLLKLSKEKVEHLLVKL
jgi:hypothetical protein